MRIAVVGTGYVGLVAGVCLADGGHDVTCVDADAEKVARLQRGEAVIFEPGLARLQQRALQEGRLRFTTSHADAVHGRRVVFIAVGTPEGPDGAPDLSHVLAAVTDTVRALVAPAVLVLKSTVPVGTAARLRELIPTLTAQPVHVVNNPEFLREGVAVRDFREPARVVVGTDSDEAFEVLRSLYAPYLVHGGRLLRMSNVSAELSKYGANAMLAVRISFANELARLCEAVGADVRDVTRALGLDPRIGPAFLEAGAGYGGSCLPKDAQGLVHAGRRAGVPMRLIEAAERVNDEQKALLVEKVTRHLGKDLKGKRIALWGLSFKPGTDDVREAPALTIAEGLAAAGAEVVGTDPEALEAFRRRFGDRLRYAPDPYTAATGADAIVLVTEWEEYAAVDWERVRSLVRRPLVIDGRNLIDAAALVRLGFEVEGVGRPRTPPV